MRRQVTYAAVAVRPRPVAVGGGSGGGRIVAEGTPEDVIHNPASHTGHYLGRHLAMEDAKRGGDQIISAE